MNLIRELTKTYGISRFAKIEAIICGWLLLISLALPKPELAFFAPELWKPIVPFHFFHPTEAFLTAAVWSWRLTLLACIAFPSRRLPLAAALIASTFCLGLCNCFWLEIQLFAPLELVILLLFALAILVRDEASRGSMAAFAVKLVVVLLFFSAGLAKLRFAGATWAFAQPIQDYLRALVPANRDVLGFRSLLHFREAILLHPELLSAGLAAVHMSELATPIALFSKRASKFLMGFFALFVLGSFIGFGINFLSILPLLIIALVWPTDVNDFTLKRKIPIGMASVVTVIVVLQISATAFADINAWPFMLNDMYARAYPYPQFDELQMMLIDSHGIETQSPGPEIHAPLLKMHVFVALFRMKNEALRTGFLKKIFEHYRRRSCGSKCDEVSRIKAVYIKDGRSETLAEAAVR